MYMCWQGRSRGLAKKKEKIIPCYPLLNRLSVAFNLLCPRTPRLTVTLFSLLISSVRRTQVLDDESDYFATDSNQWLSPNERAALRKREEELREIRHASRKDRKITLDFAGRTVLEEDGNLKQYYDK